MEHFQNINTVTELVYSISNQNHLEEHKVLFQLGSDEWTGFKQWNELGRKVKKGAKDCKIFMVCDNKDKEGKEKVLKALYVFNKDHTEEI